MATLKENVPINRWATLFLYGILGAIFVTAFCALMGVFALCVCCM